MKHARLMLLSAVKLLLKAGIPPVSQLQFAARHISRRYSLYIYHARDAVAASSASLQPVSMIEMSASAAAPRCRRQMTRAHSPPPADEVSVRQICLARQIRRRPAAAISPRCEEPRAPTTMLH